jgi:flavin reductase (DIM6/NTAB) family NADH-FMN oxidoreductase RutF
MVEIPNAAQAMGSIPSGLFILTTGRGNEATGLLTSFVQQAGFDPLAVTVAIQRQRDVAELIRKEKAFCLSILHRESKQLLAHFARGFEEGEPAFEGLSTELCDVGIPYLSDAHGHLVCELIGENTWTDHVLFCARVIGGACHGDGEPWIHLRKSGSSY